MSEQHIVDLLTEIRDNQQQQMALHQKQLDIVEQQFARTTALQDRAE